MPTQVIQSIGAGGTFPTIAAWEAASATTNLISLDQIIIGSLINQAHTLPSTGVTFANPNTNRRNFRMLTPQGVNYKFHENPNAGPRLLFTHTTGGTRNALFVNGEHGFTMQHFGVISQGGSMDAGSQGAAIKVEKTTNCIINGVTVWWPHGPSGTEQSCIWFSNTTPVSLTPFVANCLVIGNRGAAANTGPRFGIRLVNVADAKVFGCTVDGVDNSSVGASRCFRMTNSSGGNAQMYNCIGVRCDDPNVGGVTGLDFENQVTIDWRNCISSDASALTSIDGIGNVNPANVFINTVYDYRLKPSSIAVDGGEPHTGYLNVPFPDDWGPRAGLNTDITRELRNGVPDCGAYEFVPVPIVPITDVISNIGAGQTYTTIEAWRSATAQDLSAPGTAFTNTRQIGVLTDETYQLSASEIQTLTGATGITAQAHRILRAAPGNEFNQATGRGALIKGDGTQVLQISEIFFRLENVGVENTSADPNNPYHCIRMDANDITLDGVHVIMRGGGSSGGLNRSGIFSVNTASRHIVRNSMSEGSGVPNVGLSRGIRIEAAQSIVENCGAVRTGGNVAYRNGIWTDKADCIVRNCFSLLNLGGAFSLVTRGEYLVSDDNTVGVSFASHGFMDAADVLNSPDTKDFRLKPGSVCLGSGKDLSTRYSTAMAGGKRSAGQWDIGPWSGFAPQQSYPRWKFRASTGLCHCWEVRRKDGVSLFFTDYNKMIRFRGNVYTPEVGFLASSRERQGSLEVSNLHVEAGILLVTFEDLRTGKWEDARVIDYVVNTMATFTDPLEEQHYFMTEPSFDGEQWTAELLSLTDRLNRRTGRFYGYTCDAQLGDARCTVNMVPWTISDIDVSGLESNFQYDFLVATGDIPGTLNGKTVGDDFFNEGRVTWLTGANAGTTSKIKRYIHVSGGSRRIILQLRPPFQIAIGDRFDLQPGCNRLPGVDQAVGHCKNRYNNLVNFRGWFRTPGTDRALSSPQR